MKSKCCSGTQCLYFLWALTNCHKYPLYDLKYISNETVSNSAANVTEFDEDMLMNDQFILRLLTSSFYNNPLFRNFCFSGFFYYADICGYKIAVTIHMS